MVTFTIFPKWYFDTTKGHPEIYCKHWTLVSWRQEKVVIEQITISCKIHWRIETVVEKVLNQYGYILVKKRNDDEKKSFLIGTLFLNK